MNLLYITLCVAVTELCFSIVNAEDAVVSNRKSKLITNDSPIVVKEGEPMGNRSETSWEEELRLKDMVKASSPPMLVLDSLESEKKEGEEEELSWKFLTSSRKNEEEGEESRKKRGRLPEVRITKKGDCTSSSKKSQPLKLRDRVVGFSMVRAANASLAGKMGKIHFDNVFTDLNGDWNPRGSVFMCKEPGLYFFSFNARGEPINDYSDRIKEPQMDWLVTLMLNGVEVVAMGGSGEEPTSASNSILLALNPRDEVWLELVRGRLLESSDKGGAVTFSGYRVGGIDFRDVEGGDMDEEEDVKEENIEILLEEEDPYQPDDDENMDTKFMGNDDKTSMDTTNPGDGLIYENRIRDRYHNLYHQDRWQNNNNHNSNPINSYDSTRVSFQSRPNIVRRPQTTPFRRRYGQWYPMEEDQNNVRVYYYGGDHSNRRRGPSYEDNRRRYGWRHNMVRKVDAEEKEEEKRFQFVSLMEAGRRQRASRE